MARKDYDLKCKYCGKSPVMVSYKSMKKSKRGGTRYRCCSCGRRLEERECLEND